MGVCLSRLDGVRALSCLEDGAGISVDLIDSDFAEAALPENLALKGLLAVADPLSRQGSIVRLL